MANERIGAPGLERGERMWAVVCHLALLTGLGVVVPFGVRAFFTQESGVRRHAVEALNFQLTLYLYGVLCIGLAVLGIGIFLLMGLVLVGGSLAVVAAWRTVRGAPVRYPLCVPFVTK